MASRRLRRFFTSDPIGKSGDLVYLAPSDTEHLRRILRLKEGDFCLVTDGTGREAEASVSNTEGARAALLIRKIMPPQTGAGICLFVYPAFIQRGKMDELVRQMQELSVQGFFPIETERTIVKMAQEAKEKVADRWEKIVQEAAKQSGSLGKLQCEAPKPLKEVLERLPAGETLAVFHPGKNSKPFGEWIKNIEPQSRVHLFWGPEGGFCEKEISFFEQRGALQVGLGETILKADTAVLGVTAALKFLYS